MGKGIGSQYRYGGMLVAALVVSGCSVLKEHPKQNVSGVFNYAVAGSNQQLAVNSESSVPDVQPDAKSQSLALNQDGVSIEAGQCWVYAQIQPRPVQDSVNVQIKDSQIRLEVTPAELRQGFKKVVTKEGTQLFRVTPARYKQVTERVQTKPETTRMVVEPAQFAQVTEVVVLEESRTELKPCNLGSHSNGANGGQVIGVCSVELPAKTETVQVQRLVQPETVREVIVPAQYKEMTRWVVEAEAQLTPVSIPPELESLEVAELIKPAEIRQLEMPEERIVMPVKRYLGKPRIVARQALCDHDLTHERVLSLQQHLSRLGYHPGTHDGLLGKATLRALTAYQIDNGLASGAITLESVERLGLHLD